MLSDSACALDKSDIRIEQRERDVGRGYRPLTWIAPFPSRRRGLYSGRKECSPLYASLSVVAADLRLCNHYHYCTLGYTPNRLHQPATTTHTRDHTTNTSITLALSHDTPNAHQRATRDVTTHPLLAQQHHSAALPFASRQPLVLPAHLKTFILRPLLCTSRQKSPNPATTSDTATPGNAPDLISQDRIDDCASTGQSRPTRGGRRDAGG
jgi:hypothetical protein